MIYYCYRIKNYNAEKMLHVLYKLKLKKLIFKMTNIEWMRKQTKIPI